MKPKQIADEIGVSKQAVQKRLLREPLKSRVYPYIETKQGVKYIADIGETFIIESFSLNAPQNTYIDTSQLLGIDGHTHVDTLIKTLQEQLQVKDKQLESKDQQITNLQASNQELTIAIAV